MEQPSRLEKKLPPEYRTFATNLARQAGEIIRTNFKLGMAKEWKRGEIDSPVTATDIAINQLIIDQVKSRFPDHGIIGEEQSDFEESQEFKWICDPVDGTTPFSHGVPTCAFSLALTKNGESLLGVVYDPFIDRLFTAEKDGGAFLNDSPIHVSTETTLSRNVMGLELPPVLSYKFPQLRSELSKRNMKVLTVGSTIYMGALVASGEFVANIFSGDRPHDAAALKILVEEAGGKVTNLWGEDQRYDHDIQGILVSNGLVHDQLLEIIRDSKGEEVV